ncbi:MAG: DUF3604 domain-containing protein [Myxococcota bacterium]
MSAILRGALVVLGLGVALIAAAALFVGFGQEPDYERVAVEERPHWRTPGPGPSGRDGAVGEVREPCAYSVPERQPLFGDLHVHTARSQDASTQDTRVTPRDAYRFARGEPLGIQPYDRDGRPLRTVQLARPLDFTAITDHAEQIGEVQICSTPGADGYASLACRLYRSHPRSAFFTFNTRYSLVQARWGFCGEDRANCYAAAGRVWAETREAAEEAYDRSSACSFTSFVAYEWTAAPGTAHLHRNVVFRNEHVPELPLSVMETGPYAMPLWRWLDEVCREGIPGCDAITIPHNTNWSRGTAFGSGITLNGEITAEEAPLRARYERLVEIVQHKGESECAAYPGVSDEECGFEKAPNPFGFGQGDPAPDPMDFTRGALERGLELEGELGINPLAFGQIGSTDTHLGTPGLVAERGHPGHGGAGRPGNTVFESPGPPDLLTLNPGGLAAVWAEENTRDSIFDAMRRREAYATSGTRPVLRFFGGWSYDASACDSPELAAVGYAGGVPMGGNLPAAPEGAAAPTFLVAALRDPHPNGGDLDQIEIVKGWVEDGETRESVVRVVGGDARVDVDPATCAVRGRAAKSLCEVWSDPDFDPGEPAFYYARLREVPSCRWTQWACIDEGIRCDDPSGVREGWEYCCSDELPRTIQERAWSSPIWYGPR